MMLRFTSVGDSSWKAAMPIEEGCLLGTLLRLARWRYQRLKGLPRAVAVNIFHSSFSNDNHKQLAYCLSRRNADKSHINGGL